MAVSISAEMETARDSPWRVHVYIDDIDRFDDDSTIAASDSGSSFVQQPPCRNRFIARCASAPCLRKFRRASSSEGGNTPTAHQGR